MKMKFLVLGYILFLNGCSVIDDIKDNASIDQSKSNFNKMCNKNDFDDLIICGNSSKDILEKEFVEIPDYLIEDFKERNFKNLPNLGMFAVDNFSSDKYEYKADIKGQDTYIYMTPEEDGIKRGDCEDYVITFIEDATEQGILNKGEIKWKLGRADNEMHSWVIVTKNNKEYLFDTINTWGILKDKAYENHHYEELSTIYSY